MFNIFLIRFFKKKFFLIQLMSEVGSLWIGESLSRLEVMCLKSFLKNGYKVNLFVYDEVKNIPKGVKVRDGNEVLDNSEIYTYQNKSFSAISNRFRFEMIKKTGLVWVDCDMFCIKYYNFDKYKCLFTSEPDKKYKQNKINAGIIKIRNERILDYAINKCIEYKEKILNGEIVWGIGPSIVNELIQKNNLEKYLKPWNFSTSCNNKHYESIIKPDFTTVNDKSMNGITPLFFNKVKDIPEETYFIHLWNEFLRKNNFDKNNFPEDSFLRELEKLTES